MNVRAYLDSLVRDCESIFDTGCFGDIARVGGVMGGTSVAQ